MVKDIKTETSSLKNLCNWANVLGLLFSLMLCIFFFLLYGSYSFVCRNIVGEIYPLHVGEELSVSYIIANNWCSMGDISLLGIAIIIILGNFVITQIINYKKGDFTVGNFVIMVICYLVLIGLLACFLYGEYSLILNH